MDEILAWPIAKLRMYLAYTRDNPLPDPWQQTAALGHICSHGAVKPEQIIPRYVSVDDADALLDARLQSWANGQPAS